MIIGHKKTTNFLERQCEQDKLAQAYLFDGPWSVGKMTVALFLAEKILGRKIKEVDSHVLVLRSEKKIIGVEEVRDFIHQMSFSSSGDKNIFIIEEAEKLNRSSQNALLKSIEESGRNKIVILISKNTRKILPTVISRCQKITFNLVDQEEIDKGFSLSGKEKQMVDFFSGGRPGVAKRIMEDKEYAEQLKETFNNFRILFQSNLKDKMELAKKISKDSGDMMNQLEMWVMLIRKAFLKKDKSIKISPIKAFFLVEEISKVLDILKNSQANSRLVLEELFLKF